MELREIAELWQLVEVPNKPGKLVKEKEMSDTIVVTANSSESKFKAHDEGQFVGQCVDVIDLGEKVEEYQDSAPKIVHKCALIFLTGEKNDNGDLIEISREFSVSMGKKANLRSFLEGWRGKPYDENEIKKNGVPLHKLTGNHALLTIAHKTSVAGRTYANIAACVGVPKQMQNSLEDYTQGYERADFWQKKKDEYAEAVAKFKGDIGVHDNEYVSPFADDSDSELPF